MRIPLVILSAALMSGCASNPGKIEASYVSALKYRQYSCADIDTEISAINGRTAALDKKLRKRGYTNALNMTAGLVLGWPAMLLMSGGGSTAATEYSQLKGERDALLRGRTTCLANDIASTAAPVSGTQIVSRDLPTVPAPAP